MRFKTGIAKRQFVHISPLLLAETKIPKTTAITAISANAIAAIATRATGN